MRHRLARGGLGAAVLFAIGIGMGCPVRASAAPTASHAYDACMAKANSTVDMQGCQRTALVDADARLARALSSALAGLPEDQRSKLREAERCWEAFRISDCRAFYGKSDGTAESLAGGACMIDRAQDRIVQLRTFSQAPR